MNGFIVKNARVVDPSQNIDEVRDIFVSDGVFGADFQGDGCDGYGGCGGGRIYVDCGYAQYVARGGLRLDNPPD